MSQTHKSHHPDNGVPDDFEPDAPPVAPDEGPVPAAIPDDPEHDRIVDPAANPSVSTLPSHFPVEVAPCP